MVNGKMVLEVMLILYDTEHSQINMRLKSCQLALLSWRLWRSHFEAKYFTQNRNHQTRICKIWLCDNPSIYWCSGLAVKSFFVVSCKNIPAVAYRLHQRWAPPLLTTIAYHCSTTDAESICERVLCSCVKVCCKRTLHTIICLLTSCHVYTV